MNILREWRALRIKQINFTFGIFKYNEITINPISLIKGRFFLNFDPISPNEFKKPFWFYDLTKRLKIDDVISLGAYYPQWCFNNDSKNDPNLTYPVFSEIILNSKSSKLYIAPSDFIRESRIQQLRIISNFYANYLRNLVESLNYDEIIPVPAKLKYSFNSVGIIGAEFSYVFNIPMNLNSIVQPSNDVKEYCMKNENDYLGHKAILLIDDIFTNGETKDKIFTKLNEKGCKNTDLITLARTNHKIYEYNE
jgi:hypothetical protein